MKLKKVLAIGLATVCIIFSFLVSPLRAEDYYFEKHTQMYIDEKPTGTVSLLKIWVKKDRIRYFNGNDKDHVLIVHMDQDKTYRIDEKTKTVAEVDMKAKFAPIEKDAQVSSKKTEKTKKVEQGEAYQVLLTTTAQGILTEVEYWLSETIKVPMEIRKKMASYFGQEKIIEELDKYPGYPVEVAVNMNVHGKKINMVTKLAKLETKEIDQNLFEIPADYKKENLQEATKAAPPTDENKNTVSQKPVSEPEKSTADKSTTDTGK